MSDYVKISIADEIDLVDDRVQCERADCRAGGYYRIEVEIGEEAEAWWACDGNNHEHILIAEMITRLRAEALRTQSAPAYRKPRHRPGYCHNCGGDGWLPSLPEGRSECPACHGIGRETAGPGRDD